MATGRTPGKSRSVEASSARRRGRRPSPAHRPPVPGSAYWAPTSSRLPRDLTHAPGIMHLIEFQGLGYPPIGVKRCSIAPPAR